MTNLTVMLGQTREGNMAFYGVDVQDGVVQRATRKYRAAGDKGFLLIEARSAKPAWVNPGSAAKPIGNAECSHCRHCRCSVCEECSAAKQYSDYWICHCCGELNLRVSKLAL